MIDLIEKFRDEVVKTNSLQRRVLDIAVNNLNPTNRAMLVAYIEYCLEVGTSLQYLASSYDLIVKDTLSNQVYFQRHGKYKHTTYSEVANSVYNNKDYMNKYMHGLALSAFLWANHAQMLNFFRDEIPRTKSGKYLEIGPGHGFFMMEAMRLSHYDSFLGVDISETSVNLTKSILNSSKFGKFKNFEIICSDFLAWNNEDKFDAIVMGEVLEHVESPKAFLHKIRSLSKSDGYIYLTTAINAPAVDHIYLFNSSAEVTDMIESCGFIIKKLLLIPYLDKTIEESEKLKLPMNISIVLSVA
ncbi:MAG: class I SAM-dependent methyltransferase [Methylococcaceae bacterium]